MAINSTHSIHDIRYVFWAVKSGVYPYGATGTLANGEDAPMASLDGVTSFGITLPESPTEPVVGNGKRYGSVKGRPINGSITGTMNTVFLDPTFDTALRKATAYDNGLDESVIDSANCQNTATICLVIVGTGMDKNGDACYWIWEIMDAELSPQGNEASGSSVAPVPFPYMFTLDEVTSEITGVTINSTNYSINEGYRKRYSRENPVHFHVHIGDGVNDSVTLTYTPVADSGDNTQVYTDGVAETYTTNFTTTASTKTLTWQAGSIPSAGEVSIIKYEFVDSC